MRQRTGMAIMCGCALVMAGCELALDIILPTTVTITMVNTIDGFNIEGTIVYDNREALLKEDLVALGVDRVFNVAGGSSFSFAPLDCDDVESLVLDRAELQVIGDIGPSTDSEILRMGEEFECGDEIVFTFTGNILDLNVSTSVR